MKTPDITPAQIAALIVALGGQLVSWGLLNGHTEQIAVSVTTAAVAIAWKLADAYIRNGRSRSNAASPTDVAALFLQAATAAPDAAAPPVQ